MSSSRLRRAVLTAVPTALALVAVATAHAAGTVVEGVGAANVLGLSSGTNAQYVRPTQIPEAAAATRQAIPPDGRMTEAGILANYGLMEITGTLKSRPPWDALVSNAYLPEP